MIIHIKCFRSSRLEVLCKKGVLKNFSKFTRKHLCQSLFFKKETLAQVFSFEFCEILRTHFLQNTSSGCLWYFHYSLFSLPLYCSALLFFGFLDVVYILVNFGVFMWFISDLLIVYCGFWVASFGFLSSLWTRQSKV